MPLKDLKQLALLRLSGNPIKSIPEWLFDFNMNISWEGFWHDDYHNGILMDWPYKSAPDRKLLQEGKNVREIVLKFISEMKPEPR